MRLVFKPLFHVRLRHGFYLSGASVGDFRAEPSAATCRRLAEHGLVVRYLDDGWAVYAEVEPDSDPLRLLRPLGDVPLHFTFLLHAAHAHLWTITDLPAHRPGREVFVVDNLRDDALHLGDSVAAARLGPPLRLVRSTAWSHTLGAAAATATVTIRDRFASVVFTATYSFDENVSDVRVDLGSGTLPAGRYTVEDDQGGSEQIYFDPEIFGGLPFTVVEIFSQGEHVPSANRFLDGDLITAREYTFQLEPRSTTWRYHVIRKYSETEPDLDDLQITGPVTFTSNVEADRKVFDSTTVVALGEDRRDLVLELDSSSLRDLPNPTTATPLEGAPGSWVSVMYVYV